tara:strand:- start:518 stop:712 length:195 start_codon:yes stop_codon:yes gene_type:complete
MQKRNLTKEELDQICEDAFVNVKEACLTLQEKTRCSNEVVIKMLNNVVEFYLSQNNIKNKDIYF